MGVEVGVSWSTVSEGEHSRTGGQYQGRSSEPFSAAE